MARLKKGQYEVILNDEYCIAEIESYPDFDSEFEILSVKYEDGEEADMTWSDKENIRKQIRTIEMGR